MELKPGYKQTEVGVIPEDWVTSSIGDISITASGTTPPRVLADRYFRNGTIPWVKTLDLNNGTIYGTDECVTALAMKETCLKLFPKNTVLVAMYGGYAQIGRTGLLAKPGTVNQALTAILPDMRKASAGYLLYTLNHRVGYWRSVASSSRKDPNITGSDVRAFSLALPSVQEQQAIAEALGDADALIESLEQLLTKKRQIKQGAMQELLTGQRRLPGFSGEWEVGCLEDVVDQLVAGVSVNSEEADSAAGVPGVLKTSALVRGNFIPSECKVIAKSDWHRAQTNPKANTILISRMNTPDLVGEVGYVDHDHPLIFLPDRIWMTLFRSDALIDARWLCYLLSSSEYRRRIKESATGTSGSMKNISKGALLSLLIAFPPHEEQASIASVLSAIDNEITTLEIQLEKARLIKQGMMQELLTGRIRLV